MGVAWRHPNVFVSINGPHVVGFRQVRVSGPGESSPRAYEGMTRSFGGFYRAGSRLGFHSHGSAILSEPFVTLWVGSARVQPPSLRAEQWSDR